RQTNPRAGAASFAYGVGDRWAAIDASVFAKLLVTIVTIAACSVLIVSGFFWWIVSPTVDGGRIHAAHAAFVVVLLLVLTAVVLTARTALKRLLQPLSALSDGVDRLSAGELDVVLPNDAR